MWKIFSQKNYLNINLALNLNLSYWQHANEAHYDADQWLIVGDLMYNWTNKYCKETN